MLLGGDDDSSSGESNNNNNNASGAKAPAPPPATVTAPAPPPAAAAPSPAAAPAPPPPPAAPMGGPPPSGNDGDLKTRLKNLYSPAAQQQHRVRTSGTAPSGIPHQQVPPPPQQQQQQQCKNPKAMRKALPLSHGCFQKGRSYECCLKRVQLEQSLRRRASEANANNNDNSIQTKSQQEQQQQRSASIMAAGLVILAGLSVIVQTGLNTSLRDTRVPSAPAMAGWSFAMGLTSGNRKLLSFKGRAASREDNLPSLR